MSSRLCIFSGCSLSKNTIHTLYTPVNIKNTHFSTLEKGVGIAFSMMTARGQPIYCRSGAFHETRFEPSSELSEPGHVSDPGNNRLTFSLHHIFYASLRSSRTHCLAHGRDRGRQAALPNRRPRPSAHPAARICRDLADVEADHASARRAIYGNRTRPPRHRRLCDPERRSGHEDGRNSHACAGPLAGRPESGGCRPRHRTDGCLCLRRAISRGSDEARGDGCLPAGCGWLGGHLQRPEYLAFPISRADSRSSGSRPGAYLLRVLLE